MQSESFQNFVLILYNHNIDTHLLNRFQTMTRKNTHTYFIPLAIAGNNNECHVFVSFHIQSSCWFSCLLQCQNGYL